MGGGVLNNPKPERVFEVAPSVAQWCDKETVLRKYIFGDAKNLDESRLLLGPSRSKNPGTDETSPGELGLNLLIIKQ